MTAYVTAYVTAFVMYLAVSLYKVGEHANTDLWWVYVLERGVGQSVHTGRHKLRESR